MIDSGKINAVKAMLPTEAIIEEERIIELLSLAESEILDWLYSGKIPEDVTEVPSKYARIQVVSVVVGLGMIGGTGERTHSEAGISREFRYADMVDYIRKNVFQYARTL